jgi:hypothetical protein
MPLPSRQLYRFHMATISERDNLRNGTVVVKYNQRHPAANRDKAFSLGWIDMAMRADISAWLHGIEEPLANIGIVIMHIEVFAEAWRRSGLKAQLIKDTLVDNFHG